ncbi:MAG TPA: hypothetical protein ENK98_07365 [Epsilonproteobacteria bacterium]|nr:hypothetical protein [Campylobacterota bacterium]
MLPEIVLRNINQLPINKLDPLYTELINDAVKNGISRAIMESDKYLLQEERKRALKNMGIDEEKNDVFLEFYLNGAEYPKAYRIETLVSLEEILDDYKNPFWGDEYPGIEQRYLRISSIEGEGSLFYDKKTDAVYDVDWNEMDDLIAGTLEPKFNSFYDFLEWYYGDEDEE